MARSVCMLLRLLFAALFAFELVLCDETLVGIEGKNLQLHCSIEMAATPYVMWTDHVHNTGREPAKITLDDGSLNPDHDNFKNMKLDAETQTLTIEKFSNGDTGEYKCISYLEDNEEVEKEFTVELLGKPQCTGETDRHEGQLTELSCSMAVAGSSQPQVNWYRGDEKVASVNIGEVLQLTKKVTFNASSGDDGQMYTCRVIYNTLNEECSLKLSVLYAVSEVSVSPMQDEYHVGDEIHCSGNGNPTSTAVWMDVEKEDGAVDNNDAVLLVTKDMMDHDSVTYKCSVSNEVGGKKSAINKEVKFSVVGGTKAAGIVIGVIAIIIVIVVIVVAVICIRRSRSRNKGSKPIPQDDLESKPPMDSGKGGDNVSVECEKKAAESENHVQQAGDTHDVPKDGSEDQLDAAVKTANDEEADDDKDTNKAALLENDGGEQVENEDNEKAKLKETSA